MNNTQIIALSAVLLYGTIGWISLSYFLFSDFRKKRQIEMQLVEDMKQRRYYEKKFKQALELLDQLDSLQNGPPLEKYRDEFEQLQPRVSTFILENDSYLRSNKLKITAGSNDGVSGTIGNTKISAGNKNAKSN